VLSRAAAIAEEDCVAPVEIVYQLALRARTQEALRLADIYVAKVLRPAAELNPRDYRLGWPWPIDAVIRGLADRGDFDEALALAIQRLERTQYFDDVVETISFAHLRRTGLAAFEAYVSRIENDALKANMRLHAREFSESEAESAGAMRYPMAWVAVRGKALAKVAAAFGLSRTRKQSKGDDGDLLGCELPTGWCLLVAHTRDDATLFEDDHVLARCSSKTEVVTCCLEETTMTSRAVGYVDGRQTWDILHAGDGGADQLETSGELPSVFSTVNQKQCELQRTWGSRREVDYMFEIPIETAGQIVGFRRDDLDRLAESVVFHVLRHRRRRRPR
jgi:hypothetical protein